MPQNTIIGGKHHFASGLIKASAKTVRRGLLITAPHAVLKNQWSFVGFLDDYVMGTTELSEDYVFLNKNHDHGTTDAIWVIKKDDPESHCVQFYKIELEDKIGVVTVKCTELEAEKTKIVVTYKYMALSATGEKFVSEFDESAYADFIGEWQALLSKYFKSKR